MTADEKINKALKLIFRWGDQQEQGHHLAWEIDQLTRILAGNKYKELVETYEEGGEYRWNEGIPP